MPQVQGKVAFIGSGELSGTMVETHKKLLAGIKSSDLALFLDTPAGFQENADLITKRAVDYFTTQVLHKLDVVSFKSAEAATSIQAGEAFSLLGRAGYVLFGPGSPTYVIGQLKATPVPALLGAMINRGGCLVAASAAALSIGTHTLPVYEIYKVGEPLHWVPGLNILGNLNFNLVVIPHWNNAEGGNHDTSYCYMGEKRFTALEAMLPPGTTILGIDEHTVCILNFAAGMVTADGLGRVTVRQDGLEYCFSRGEMFPLGLLNCNYAESRQQKGPANRGSSLNGSRLSGENEVNLVPAFLEKINGIDDAFQLALKKNDIKALNAQILEAYYILWQAQINLEEPEPVSQGWNILWEMIVHAGTAINELTTIIPEKLYCVVRDLVGLREEYRNAKKWQDADRIRSILLDAGIAIEDTGKGPQWQI